MVKIKFRVIINVTAQIEWPTRQCPPKNHYQQWMKWTTRFMINRLPIKEIADTIGISKERICWILHEILGMEYIFAWWILCLLTTEQKRNRVLQSTMHFVTVDESWFHHYIPETKQQSRHWTFPGESVLKNVGRKVHDDDYLGFPRSSPTICRRKGQSRENTSLVLLAIFFETFMKLLKQSGCALLPWKPLSNFNRI